MNFLRTPEQTALADLNAFGAGLLHRYAVLIDAEIDSALVGVLQAIETARRPVLDELARCERARGEPPKAADQEINELRSAADRLLGYLFGPQAPAQRVLDAEQAWADRLDKAGELSWRPREAAVLERLVMDSRQAREWLARC